MKMVELVLRVWGRGERFVWVAFCMFACFTLACDRNADSKPKPEPTGAASAEQASPPPVELLFVYGSEKKSWLADAIESFNRSAGATVGSARIVVKGAAAGSGTSLDDIVS